MMLTGLKDPPFMALATLFSSLRGSMSSSACLAAARAGLRQDVGKAPIVSSNCRYGCSKDIWVRHGRKEIRTTFRLGVEPNAALV
jgi:hypothetical protein